MEKKETGFFSTINLPLVAAFLIVILSVAKIGGLIESLDYGGRVDTLMVIRHFLNIGYLVRHVIFLVIWLVLLYYFYTLHVYNNMDTVTVINMKDMEKASIAALIACIIKVVVTGMHLIAIFRPSISWIMVYNITELLVWITITSFIFAMWRRGLQLRKEAEKQEFDQEITIGQDYVVEEPELGIEEDQ